MSTGHMQAGGASASGNATANTNVRAATSHAGSAPTHAHAHHAVGQRPVARPSTAVDRVVRRASAIYQEGLARQGNSPHQYQHRPLTAPTATAKVAAGETLPIPLIQATTARNGRPSESRSPVSEAARLKSRHGAPLPVPTFRMASDYMPTASMPFGAPPRWQMEARQTHTALRSMPKAELLSRERIVARRGSTGMVAPLAGSEGVRAAEEPEEAWDMRCNGQTWVPDLRQVP